MTVFTYFVPVPGMAIEEETRLLLLWKRNWSEAGYEPVVLNQFTAWQHPKYDEYIERIGKIPSINTREYEMACWTRWLAMVEAGGGLMTDYDVFVYGIGEPWLNPPPDLLEGMQKHIPCCVYGSQKAYERVLAGFLRYEIGAKDLNDKGQPHVSDMTALASGKVKYQPRDVVKSFGEDGWLRAPFVHYPHAAMHDWNPRWKHIERLRPWKT